MAIDPGRVKALFQAAIERDDPADRRAFLDGKLGDDPAMRERLDALLAEHDRPRGPLDRPLDADFLATFDLPGATGVFAPEAPGHVDAGLDRPARSHQDGDGPTPLDTVIAGRYRLRQEIGEGGMGSVYLAEQLQPVRRMVALKLIKPGMDTRNVLARFESERQALALMDHPNIAKVLDAGSTEAGRPYFVMELVKGVPITEYCDRHRLGIPERLAIFRQVCSAVQHAHQKGIIHRDLKPSNILVEAHDDRPVPKVIDFGLAKATSGMKLTDQSLFTAFGSVTGTPLYMAPEQASFNALDVDTRADIYALGVILYELLTGSTPIRRDTIQRAALDEMLRVIREDEPPTPSSRISTSEALPGLAANRHMEPTRLSRFVRGDLDWIVMKALAKERHRRYDSAIGLANDLERFTNHEPVSAGPPSSSYRLRKFLRRNRVQVVAAAPVLLALVGGMVGTTLGLLEARWQQRLAVAQQREAVAQRERAEKRLTQIEKANQILGSIFTDLNPQYSQQDDKPLLAVLGERLDQATAQLEGEAIGDPLAVARMQLTLGRSQINLGYPEKAIALLTRARVTFAAQLGPDHPETLFSTSDLGSAYLAAGKPDRALPLLEESLARKKSKLGPDHPETLVSMANLAEGYRAAGRLDRALPLLRATADLQRRKSGSDSPGYAGALAALGWNLLLQQRWTDAEPILRKALTIREAKEPDDWRTFNSGSLLGGALLGQKKFAEAEPLLRSGYEGMKQRADKIPLHVKGRIVEALDRLIELAEGHGQAGRCQRMAGREAPARPLDYETRAGEQMSEPARLEGYFPLVYHELKRLAAARLAGEGQGHSLDATALVHEAYLRLGEASFADRSGFFRAAAVAMQRILVDHARRRRAGKRGGGERTLALDGDAPALGADPDLVLDVDEALARLAAEDPCSAEVARHRLFAGLSIDEAAEALGLSRATAFREWAYARSWLAHALMGTRIEPPRRQIP